MDPGRLVDWCAQQGLSPSFELALNVDLCLLGTIGNLHTGSYLAGPSSHIGTCTIQNKKRTAELARHKHVDVP